MSYFFLLNGQWFCICFQPVFECDIIRVDSDYPNYLLINVMNDFHVTLKKKSKSKIQLLNDWLQKESMVQEVSLFLAA